MSNSMKVVTIFNQKGGVGKSPTAVALAYSLARQGRKILFIDADPQGTASLHFLGVGYKTLQQTLFNGITSTRNVETIAFIEPIVITECLHLIPTHDELEQAEILLTSKRSFTWQFQLKKLLELYPDYDYVVIDTPGSRVSIFSTLALVAADYVIVPVKTTMESQQATIDSINLIEDLRALNPNVLFFAIIPNQYEGTRHHKEIVELLNESYPNKVYEASRKSVKYADALAFKADIRDLDPQLGEYWDVIAKDIIKLGGGAYANI